MVITERRAHEDTVIATLPVLDAHVTMERAISNLSYGRSCVVMEYFRMREWEMQNDHDESWRTLASLKIHSA